MSSSSSATTRQRSRARKQAAVSLQRILTVVSITVLVVFLAEFQPLAYARGSVDGVNNSIEKTNDTPPHLIEQKPLPHQLGMYRHLQTPTADGFDIYAVTLRPAYRASLYKQEASTPFFAKTISQLSRENDFMVAINGGFFTPEFEPAGLFIAEGQVLHKIGHDKTLTSCVAINRDKRIILEKNREDCLAQDYAMQSGPWLLDHGKINPRLVPVESQKRLFFTPHRRTILALANDDQLIILTTSDATLWAIANILKDYPQVLGVKTIQSALNLDGGSSTGLFVRLEDEPFYFPEQNRVKTFLFFYPS